MNDVLSNWGALQPADPELLLQRGGTLVFQGANLYHMHLDKGILGYANVDDTIALAKEAVVRELP